MKFGSLYLGAVLKHSNGSPYTVLELDSGGVKLSDGKHKGGSPFTMDIKGFNYNTWTDISEDVYEIW